MACTIFQNTIEKYGQFLCQCGPKPITCHVALARCRGAFIDFFYWPQNQSTVGIGTRYDLSPNIALKAQIDRIEHLENGQSFDRPTVDDFTDEGDDVTLYSLVLDIVF